MNSLPRPRSVLAVVSATIVAGLAGLAIDAGQATAQIVPRTTRVSVASDGTEGDDASGHSSLSSDGRFVAFESDATILVANDNNGDSDIFVRDRLAETTERVSVSSAGVEAKGDSLEPSISADGRFVAFQSRADNLVARDGDQVADVFVRDRLNSTTERISVALGGGDPNSESREASISSDGRYVAFQSLASNLVANDGNGDMQDIFVFDRSTGTTERVSLAQGGGDPNGNSTQAAISGDGRFVSFASGATNLVSGADTFGLPDVFLFDRVLRTTIKVSVGIGGLEAAGGSINPALSADGRYLAFESTAFNLVLNEVSFFGDVFLFDRISGTIQLLSVEGPGLFTQGQPGPSQHPSISGDGRLIAFESFSRRLLPGDTFGGSDIYVADRDSSRLTRVSIGEQNSRGGIDGDMCSSHPAISADAYLVSYKSNATNLVAGDGNLTTDVFVSTTGAFCQVNADCNDGNPCHELGVCDTPLRTCSIPARKPDDTPCNDQNLCTGSSRCQLGTCTGFDPVVCAPQNDCYEPGVCNPTTGECFPIFKPFGAPCDNGDNVRCSQPDFCSGGLCYPGGDGDHQDDDLVCEFDDNCPATSNPDQANLDGDTLGDRCDPIDAPLTLRRVRFLRDTSTSSDNGRIKLKGQIVLASPQDLFSASEGLSVMVTDRLNLGQLFQWTATECRQLQGGRIRCHKNPRPIVLADFHPLGPSSPDAARAYAFEMRFGGLGIQSPFQPPVEVTVTTSPGNLIEGIDRRGSNHDCASTPGGMICSGGG